MPIATDEVSKNAMGGTEMMKYGLQDRVDSKLLDHFHITASRYRGPQAGKVELYWLHDLPGDPESAHLANGGWNKFEKLIFVSNWQFQQYQAFYGLPWHKSIVLQNAIDPIVPEDKSKDKIIYNTTPHRGLEILVPVFEKLAEKHPNVELDVFSSFKAYGWEERDKPYEELFQRCKDHPKINYHGYQPNNVVRKALAEAHIQAYPSIWQETSCLCAIEAMSSRALTVTSSLAALPETCSNYALMYNYTEDVNAHANMFFKVLNHAINVIKSGAASNYLRAQKEYFDRNYSWEMRKEEWTFLLNSLL